MDTRRDAIKKQNKNIKNIIKKNNFQITQILFRIFLVNFVDFKRI